MSRYNPHHEVDALLEAARQWRDSCLLEDGSLFDDTSLWTTECLDELNRVFIQNPIESSETFIDKLMLQLANASPEATQLMAELNWLLQLFSSNITSDKKRNYIRQIWKLSGASFPDDSPLITDQVLGGVGSTGTGFNSHRWRELVFLIDIARAFKRLDRSSRQKHLNEPWDFCNWMANIPREGARQFRHILPFLLFPDTFERVSVTRHKTTILESIAELPKYKINGMSDVEVDKALAELRTKLEHEQDTDIDFYESPWIELWQQTQRTWLIGWNSGTQPDHWNTFQDDRLLIATGENLSRTWAVQSSGVREGDVVYVMKIGCESPGMIARGNVSSAPYKADETSASEGKAYSYVDIILTDLRDPEVDDYISLADLQARTTDGQNWAPPDSDIEIQPSSAKLIGLLWHKLAAIKVVKSEPKSAKQEAISIARPVNQIFYGPPGTGKTYHLRTHLMPRYESQANQVSTEEWLEEQLANTSWWETTALALADLGGNASVNQLLIHPYFKAKARIQGRLTNLRQTCWDSLQRHAVLESEMVKTAAETRTSPLIFDKQIGSRWILTGEWEEIGDVLREKLKHLKQGPANDDERIKRHLTVTFHQSYSYEDFIEGIRPQVTEAGTISYEVRDGLFKKFCRRASRDPKQRYALFIDEINRGNISRIFGELITLIEADKRAWWNEEDELAEGVELVLPYSGERFGVPKNLDIYATMNTADRSIALMDAALRRRFHFHELMPEPKRIPGSQGNGYIPDGEGGLLNLRALLQAINLRLRYLLHRDQTFGHAYFTDVKDLDALRRVMVYDIIPMLAEYFYDDWRQIRRVLADEWADLEQQLITAEPLVPTQLFSSSDDLLSERLDYRVKTLDEISADAIKKIYESLESEA